MAKIINIDSSIDNADWAKKRTLDAGQINSSRDVLKFMGISTPMPNLTRSQLFSIENSAWFGSLPLHIRREFGKLISELPEPEKK